SDYTADFELVAHGFAANEREATKLSLTAGVDMSMQSGLYAAHLPDLGASGEVPMEVVDRAVRGVLAVKQAIGLFDDPYRSLDPDVEAALDPQALHFELAREAARRSIVLLKNDGDLLPLRRSGQKIALIGPY